MTLYRKVLPILCYAGILLLSVTGCTTQKKNIETYSTPGLTAIAEWHKEAAEYRALGDNEYNKNQFKQALIFYHDALNRERRIDNMVGIAQTHNAIALTYITMKEWALAYTNILEAQYYNNLVKNEAVAGDTATIFGKYYISRNEYAPAIPQLTEALTHFRIINNTEKYANTLNSIALCHLYLHHFNEAKSFLLNAIDRNRQIRNYRQLAANYNNLGRLYIKTEKYNDATEAFGIALIIDKRLQDSPAISIDLMNLAYSYEIAGNADAAIEYAQRAYDIKSVLYHQTPTEALKKDLIECLNSLKRLTAVKQRHMQFTVWQSIEKLIAILEKQTDQANNKKQQEKYLFNLQNRKHDRDTIINEIVADMQHLNTALLDNDKQLAALEKTLNIQEKKLHALKPTDTAFRSTLTAFQKNYADYTNIFKRYANDYNAFDFYISGYHTALEDNHDYDMYEKNHTLFREHIDSYRQAADTYRNTIYENEAALAGLILTAEEQTMGLKEAEEEFIRRQWHYNRYEKLLNNALNDLEKLSSEKRKKNK